VSRDLVPQGGVRRARDAAELGTDERFEQREHRAAAAPVAGDPGRGTFGVGLDARDAIPGCRVNTFGLLMSVNMLIETQAGFDYTATQCRSWMADTGFSDSYAQPLPGPDSMVVGIK
jgi:hypothetical protein